MIERFKNKATLFALLAAGLTALGVGGVAIAQSGGQGSDKPAAAAQEREADEPGDKSDANEKGEKGDDANEKGEKGDDANEKGEKGDDANEKGEQPGDPEDD